MTGGTLTSFLESGIRFATPLAYAALGELVVERSGIINIGLEGAIISGAFGALVFAGSGSVWIGFAGAALAGIVVSALHALFVVTLRTDQIITGTAMSMLGLGLTGTLYRTVYGNAGASLRTPTIAPVPVPGLSHIPIVGPAFFTQPVVTYALYAIVPMLSWWFYRSAAGLALRAVGEIRRPPERQEFPRTACSGARSSSAERWAASAAERSYSHRWELSARECLPDAASSRSRSWCSDDGRRSGSRAPH